MRLLHLELKKINQFSSLSIDFSSATSDLPITLILGEQNAGKSNLLKQIFHGLSWFSGRHKDLRGAGIIISDNDIQLTKTQASIDLTIRCPKELGSLSADQNATPSEDHVCSWQIKKIKNANASIGLSRAETADLELLIPRYQKQVEQDPHFSTPCIAYYPSERFVHEVNLQIKNTGSSLTPIHNAYDLVSISFTTFTKFFEWLREVHDLENAQSAQLLRDYLNPKTRFQTQENLNEIFSQLEQAYRLAPQRCLNSLRQTLQIVLPDISDLYIEFQPRLRLMVTYQGENIPFLQLSQSYKTWIALIGDLVRRLCILNPNSLYPCTEGEGIVIIDEIDLQLDIAHRQNILSRLHQAFPQLQFIASAINADVLEREPEIECFVLQHQKASKLNLNEHQLKLQSIYQSLNHDMTHDTLPIESVPQTTQNPNLSLDEMIDFIKQFNEQEQVQLFEHLKKYNQS